MSVSNPPREKPARPKNIREQALLCAAAAADKKALDLLMLDVGEITGFADYFLLASARSTRQASAIAENVARVLKKAGIKPIGQSGLGEGNWALIDFGDVVVHVFHQPVREFYDLESLWDEAPVVELDPEELAALLSPSS